jgi:hypothetical protein
MQHDAEILWVLSRRSHSLDIRMKESRIARSLANPRTPTIVPAGISKHEKTEMGAN